MPVSGIKLLGISKVDQDITWQFIVNKVVDYNPPFLSNLNSSGDSNQVKFMNVIFSALVS